MFKLVHKYLLSLIILSFTATPLIAQTTNEPQTNLSASQGTPVPIYFSVLVNYSDANNSANTGIKQITMRQTGSSSAFIDSKTPLTNSTTRYRLTGTINPAPCNCKCTSDSTCACNSTFINFSVQIYTNDGSLYQFKGICALQNFSNGNPITEYQFDVNANTLSTFKPGTPGIPLIVHQIDASTDISTRNSLNANNCLLERF